MRTRLIAFASIIALFSCTREELVNPYLPQVTLEMGVLAPEFATRSFGEEASVSSLRVVVFDASGCYSESAEATDLTPGQGVDGRETTFHVTLTATSDPVSIHLVANYDPGRIAFGVETEIIGRMETSGGDDAYWQRVSVPGGIPADGSTPGELRRIPLVRNFAAVDVVCDVEHFTFKGWALTNVPDRGSVAPYMQGGDGFAPYVGETCPSYDDLHDAGYKGFTPADAVLEGHSGSELSFGTGRRYIYEHPYTGDASTYTSVILWGRKEGRSTDSYYKADIVRSIGGVNEYYDLLRNMRYTLTVTSVSGNGYTSAQLAMDAPAGNNVAGSVNTDDLRNISDGDGQLFVSETSLTFVSEEPLTLRYRWVPYIHSAPNTTDNGAVTVSAPAGDVLISSSVASSDVDGWRTITLTPKAASAIVREQVITVTTNTGLQKKIRLVLRPKYTMSVAVSPASVPKTIGEEVTVSVTLPAGLPESIFPLSLTVSTDGSTLYPDASLESMPVQVTTPTYGFVRTVSRSLYLSLASGGYVLPIHMKTNCKESATTVRVNEYHFNEGVATFTNP